MAAALTTLKRVRCEWLGVGRATDIRREDKRLVRGTRRCLAALVCRRDKRGSSRSKLVLEVGKNTS